MTELDERLYVFTKILTSYGQYVYVRFYLKTSTEYKQIFNNIFNNVYMRYKDDIYVEENNGKNKELIFSHSNINDHVTIPLNEIKSIIIKNEFGDYCFTVTLNNEDCFIVGTW